MKKFKFAGLLFACAATAVCVTACGGSGGKEKFTAMGTQGLPTLTILSNSVIKYKESNTTTLMWYVVSVTISKNVEEEFVLDSLQHKLSPTDGWLIGDPQNALDAGIKIENGELGGTISGTVVPYNNKGETQTYFEENKKEGETFTMHHFAIVGNKPKKMIVDITSDFTYTFEFSKASAKETITVTIPLNDFKSRFAKL